MTIASLKALAGLVPLGSQADVRRFRPNIVIGMDEAEPGFPRSAGGCGSATRWVAVTEPCERCSFTALAQGELPFANEVLHAIARHGGGGFGALASVVEAPPIQHGDAVSLI
ncbi:MOSC domain-containing protein [Pararhizobium sp. DWP3-4]|uniref:MOSC domain-containing protein n=1 Tax=Pararhizobium sp. DWP3-4 TaxID=2804565 RepID=UPI003CF6380C